MPQQTPILVVPSTLFFSFDTNAFIKALQDNGLPTLNPIEAQSIISSYLRSGSSQSRGPDEKQFRNALYATINPWPTMSTEDFWKHWNTCLKFDQFFINLFFLIAKNCNFRVRIHGIMNFNHLEFIKAQPLLDALQQDPDLLNALNHFSLYRIHGTDLNVHFDTYLTPLHTRPHNILKDLLKNIRRQEPHTPVFNLYYREKTIKPLSWHDSWNPVAHFLNMRKLRAQSRAHRLDEGDSQEYRATLIDVIPEMKTNLDAFFDSLLMQIPAAKRTAVGATLSPISAPIQIPTVKIATEANNPAIATMDPLSSPRLR